MDSLTFPLTLTGAILTGIVIAVLSSRWALLLYYNQDLQKRDKFFKHYDQFVKERSLRLLQGSEGKFSDEYKTHAQLHQDTRGAARSYCIRYMGVVGLLNVVIVLFIPMILVSTSGSAYPLLLILFFLASMAFRIIALKQGGRFYASLMLKIIFKRMNRTKR